MRTTYRDAIEPERKTRGRKLFPRYFGKAEGRWREEGCNISSLLGPRFARVTAPFGVSPVVLPKRSQYIPRNFKISRGRYAFIRRTRN